MSTIEAIRVLLPAVMGIWIGKAWFAWRNWNNQDEEWQFATFVDWTLWMGICLALLGVSALWERMS